METTMAAIVSLSIESLVLICFLTAAAIGFLLLGRQRKLGISERRALLGKTSELLVLLDEDLIVRDISRSITKSYRITRAECVGRNITATPLWPDTVRCRRELVRSLRMAMKGRTTVVTYENSGPGGKRGTFELKVFPAAKGRRTQIYCLGRDVSIEKTMREAVRRRNDAEDVIVRISLLAISSDSLRNGIPGILEISGTYLKARRAVFLQLDHSGTVTWNAMWSDPKIEAFDDDWVGIRIADLFPYTLEPVITVIEDLAENESVPEAYRKAARKIGTGSLVVLTLADRDGSVLGYAGFVFRGPRPDESALDTVFLRMYAATLTGMLSKVGAQRDTELFRQSVDAAGQGIVIIDADDRVVYGNRSYGSLSGNDNRGDRPAWEIYDGSYSAKVRDLILPMVRRGEAWRGELRIKGPGGKPLSTIESFHPIELGSDGIQYVVNTMTDITIRKGLEEQLIKAKKEAEFSNRAKTHYLANMSHEIRTPMNAVIGLTYLALQTDLDERQSDYLGKIRAAAKSLLAIINDILDLSKIESGKLDLESAAFSLDEVMENTADMASDKAWEKGLKMYCRRPPGMSDTWIGDRYRLGQVLLNLVGNAVKFTETGHVAILADTDGRSLVKFTVEDTGIGMTEEQVGKLFQPFGQADASTARRYGGTGLGLTISKQIVEMMGGTFSVTSRPGEGSRFSFTARLGRPAGDSAGDGGEEAIARGKTAWVVSADPVSAKFHEDALIALGADARRLPTVKAALLEPGVPDILLLDVDSMKHNPAEVASALCDGSCEGRILLLSGSMNAAALGAYAPPGIPFGSLPIPYGRTRLARTLVRPERTSVVGRTRGEGAVGSAVVLGRVLLADDNEVNRQVGSELLEHVGLTVDTAADGKEAVEACARTSYAIVFMDLQMPVMSGYEAASLIRQAHPEVPVIAMSASTVHDAKSTAGEAGFTAYLAKPIDPDELYRAVGDVLALPVTTFRASRSPAKGGTDLPDIPGMDMAAALRQVLGNRERLRGILRRFADENRRFPERLAGAFAAGNLDAAASLLHALRGAAGHIGSTEVKDEAGRLEEAVRSGSRPDAPELKAFLESVAALTAGIAGALPGLDVVQILNRLEDLIRSSDPGTAAYLEKQIPGFASEDYEVRARRIIEALENWNFDAALDEVDDWRMSVGGKAR